MFDHMDFATSLTNYINYEIGATKSISWNEMYQKTVEDFFSQVMEKIEENECITIADWAFDINTLNALTAHTLYAHDNGINVITNYEYSMMIICGSKEAMKEALKKLPEYFIMTSEANVKNIDVTDNECIIYYYDHAEVKKFETRPEYMYNVMQLGYGQYEQDTKSINEQTDGQ